MLDKRSIFLELKENYMLIEFGAITALLNRNNVTFEYGFQIASTCFLFYCPQEFSGMHCENVFTFFYVKGKAVPLQAWSGSEGSWKLGLPYFMTAAQDGGKVVSLTHRPPLPPGNAPGTHFC